VHALTADQLSGKTLTYNARFGLSNSNALVYVESSRLADTKAGKIPIEPLVLRVGAGDCVHVKIVNDFTQGSAQFPPAQPTFGVLGPPNQVWGSIPIFNYNIRLTASKQVGLHPQLLSYDVTDSNGFNIGKNPDQTACNPATAQCAKTAEYTWYAGDLFDPITGDFKPHPVEFGATNLLASDSMYQGANGLIGALIVEPAGFKFQPDMTSQVSGLVNYPSGKSFREGVVITQDYTFQRYNIAGSTPGATAPFPGLTAVNYGSEP
jgi:hypothetical protein